LVAITGNYQEAVFDADDDVKNRFVRVRLDEVRDDGRWESTLMGVEALA
jgi:hypothetical protein